MICHTMLRTKHILLERIRDIVIQMEAGFWLHNGAKAPVRCSSLSSAPALISSLENQQLMFQYVLRRTFTIVIAFALTGPYSAIYTP